MRDTIFWNEDDSASSTFVQRFKSSGISRYAQFTSFHVRHPSQQPAQVNKLLSILEVDVLPTLFYQGQAFQGPAAFEWLEYQILDIRGDQQDAEQDTPQRPESTSAMASAMDPAGSEGFAPFTDKPQSLHDFGPNAFANVVAGVSGRGISEEQLRAAENERLSQIPAPAART